jgi:hypothetical protein
MNQTGVESVGRPLQARTKIELGEDIGRLNFIRARELALVRRVTRREKTLGIC